MDKRRRVWERVLGREGKSHVDEIYSSHSSEKEKTHACSDIYINCCPKSSWEHLTSWPYEEDEMTAVDQARPFLPPRGNYKCITSKQHLMFVGGHMGHAYGCNVSASWGQRSNVP